MKFVFIFGRSPDLSLCELDAALVSSTIGYSIVSSSREVCIIETAHPIDCAALQHRLGGTVKIGAIQETSFDSLEENIEEVVRASIANSDERVTFGLSAYTLSRENKKESMTPKRIQALGLNLKKKLRSEDFSVRFVSPEKGVSLSSVAVEKNGLTDDNSAEILLLSDGKKFLLGKTLTVQPFEEYSNRDWNRPHRNMETGLLPPKLADILINLSRCVPSATLLDPFCGFGTVLQEAAVMGYVDLFGSDIQKENVSATRENLAWLSKTNGIEIAPHLQCCDARHLTAFIEKKSIDAIVTEPYLGPIVTTPHSQKILETQKELSRLYFDFYSEARSVLKNGGTISAVWPVWMSDARPLFLSTYDDIIRLGYKNCTINERVKEYVARPTFRNTLLYARPGQHVAREVIVLKKI